jgi:hypothetical protein
MEVEVLWCHIIMERCCLTGAWLERAYKFVICDKNIRHFIQLEAENHMVLK